ncbi:MAG: hypothetical protein CSA68_12360 [Rhodobacterales bacterium]|nr:MAG: hypothetical protein CSA68_12360 [Rhodobacterales bacterium]
MPRTSFAALALGLIPALLAPAAQAQAPAGAYLAARHASFSHDYAAGARYYTQALLYDPSNPNLMANAMMSFVGLGDVELAVGVAEKMAADGVVSQVSRMVLISHLIKQQKYDQVIDMLSKGEAVSAVVDSLAMGWAELGRGNMVQAIEYFGAVAKERGTRAFGLYHMALALASIGDFTGAERIFSGKAHGPLRATVHSVFAHVQVLSQLGRNKEALELLGSVFGDSPDPRIQHVRDALEAGDKLPFDVATTPAEGMSEVFFTLANAIEGETDDSYTLVYSRMTEFLKPQNADAVLLSAGLLERLERFDMATKAYNSIARSDASFYAAELGRASALRKAGKTDTAIEVLQQLVKSHGNLSQVHSALGDLLRRQERYDQAITAYDQAVRLIGAPLTSDWFLYYARGICFERNDQWDKAQADFQMALRLKPDQPQVMNYLGYSMVEKGIQLQEALTMIKSAVRAQPNDGYITDSLGWALYRLNRFDEAIGHMERAAQLVPVDPVINDHLGDTLWAVGRKNEARFQWRRALSFEPEETDMVRIRRKLEVGLDQVLHEEGAKPIQRLVEDR